VVLVHVDDGKPAPETGDVPDGLSVVRKAAKGSLEDAIVELSVGFDACAIVMATRGHDGVLDAIAGSHTEHVVRRVGCPLLSVPIPA
jgi:nucleotide-binding universal stress UspA family protein